MLAGWANLLALLRAWALIYLGNAIGGILFAAFLVLQGPCMGIIPERVLADLALHPTLHASHIVLGSAILAG